MKISKILIANRGEIAIRISRAANELGCEGVAIYAQEDRMSLHRLKVNEAHRVGAGKGPVEAYLDIDDIIRVALETGANAVHPGYGFLSENPDFAERCAENGLIFIGPRPEVMRKLGDKVSARQVAIEAGVPVIPATDPLSDDPDEIMAIARKIGLPLMLKASWGGGGRGMRVIRDEKTLVENVRIAKQEALNFFGRDEVYFEKLIEDARHIEVQILGDNAGNVVHLFERDCSLQRRHQKVIERAPAPNFSDQQREDICSAAVKLCKHVGVNNASTVEFLVDSKTGEFYFIEVNPRVQVEHTITEEITGLDIVKAQILIASGETLGGGHRFLPAQKDIKMNGVAMQCRVTTENPANNFIPDYGRIIAYRSPAGPGVRLDGANSFSGAVVTRYYDSLLVKVTTRGRDHAEACDRMNRCLLEFRIRGVETNLPFLQLLINHDNFLEGKYNTQFIDTNAALFKFPESQDRATRLLRYIGHVIVNGSPEVKGRPVPVTFREPAMPALTQTPPTAGLKNILLADGPDAVVKALHARKGPMVTDTTMRDAHQSLLATRMRSHDIAKISPAYAQLLPELFSAETWGGATFDVAMRFLKEDPWARLSQTSKAMPNIMQQMLLRASNAVGYKNYPDNVVKFFIEQAAAAGVDVFRIFDSLNWTENMRVAIDAVGATGKIVEAAICYTGDILDPNETKFTLQYYVNMAKELESAGAHILGLKDMAGLLKPAAAHKLISALKDEVGLPIHFHTHDLSGIASATILSAVDAGVDVFDAAIDSMSGITSQPSMGSLVAALEHTDKPTGLAIDNVRALNHYWGQVRDNYAAFEQNTRAGASEVYIHEMPGGQYSNLREQARSLGLETRWPEVAQTYSDVNAMFGNIVKVTPSSKVVGDMTLAMVTAGITRVDVENPDKEVAFPDSVVSFFAGELGQPPNGFPKALQKKVLGKRKAITARPGSILPPVDMKAEREAASEKTGRPVSDQSLASYLLYPEVFQAYSKHRTEYGNVSLLPTPAFFYGMEAGDEITINIERGRQAIIRFLAVSDPDTEGQRNVFFELNGISRSVKVDDQSVATDVVRLEKADPNNQNHVAAPMPGLVSSIDVSVGEMVEAGQTILVLEAMKMQTAIPADRSGVIERLPAIVGQVVEAKDLLCVIKDPS